MSCLPIGRRLKRFRQILRKMLPSTSKLSIWTKSRYDDDKENIMPDSNTSSPFPDHVDPFSDISRIWQFPSSNRLPTKLQQSSDVWDDPYFAHAFSFNKEGFDEPASAASSGYGSLFEQKDNSSMFASTHNSIPYSPLSTFNVNDDFISDFSSDLNLNDLLSTPPTFAEHNGYDDVRRDFEMNGRTEELNTSFIPSQCSTPMTDRKSQQWQRQNDFTFYKDFTPYIPPTPKPCPPPFREKVKKRSRPDKKSLIDHCVFCKNNGENERNYRSHSTKDASGKVICPKLRSYTCPICKETDDKAHTIKYCPKRPIVTLEDTKQKNFKL